MLAKRIVCFFIALLLFSGLMCSVDAVSDTTVSFHGVGVTIDLKFPEEAQPGESIWHNATITANIALTLRNLTVVIKAPVNSNLQEVFTGKDERNIFMPENDSFQWSMGPILLPQETNGKLYCFIYVNTSQSTDYAACTFYTTLVSDPTFSEIQSKYDALRESYDELNATYTALDENFTALWANYTALLSEHNQLITNYNSKVAAYASLLAQYNKLSDDYDTLNANYRSKIAELGDLQTNYDDLNTTRYNLQASYNTLQTIYEGLNQTYIDLQTELANLQERINVSEGALSSDRIVMFIFTVAVAGLIVFIVYLKRKKEEPYVVIRKETVSMKSDEES
jgi:predicted nuclease with TOPRIM domain